MATANPTIGTCTFCGQFGPLEREHVLGPVDPRFVGLISDPEGNSNRRLRVGRAVNYDKPRRGSTRRSHGNTTMTWSPR